MGIGSYILKAKRWIRNKWFDLIDLIPIQKPKLRRKKSKRSKRKYKDDVQYERNVRHIPFYRTFKRILAAILLLFNLIFSQFLLGTSSAGQIMFLVFLANAFILADYLWKMRRKSDED